MKRVVSAVTLVVGLGALAASSGGGGGTPRAPGRVTGSPISVPVTESSAWGLTDDGVVVGFASDGDESMFPFLWRPGSPGERLDPLARSFGGSALSIGANGDVVGEFISEDALMVPVRWTPEDGLTRMDTLGGAFTLPRGMNASGVAVGISNTGDDDPHAVRWDRSGAVTDLGTLGDAEVSAAFGINDEGVIVGQSGPSDLRGPAVRWAPDGTITQLSTPAGSENAVAYAVNAAGVAVGEAASTDVDGDLMALDGQAVRWSSDGTAVRLTVQGGGAAIAWDINDSGEVAGAVRRSDGTERAVRWSPDGTGTELRPLDGDVSSHARAINNRGHVAGESVDAKGRSHAVLWHPDGSVTTLVRHSNHTVLPSPPASPR